MPQHCYDTSSLKVRWAGLLFAMLLPTLITWAYFVLASAYPQGMKQAVYLIAKVVQFGFPVLWVLWVLREPIRTGRPTAWGLGVGAVFGVVVVAAGVALFQFVLRELPMFAAGAERIHGKVDSFGIDSVAKFIVLSSFYSLFHSLMEEYYWRWFVFRQLRAMVPMSWAVVGSGVAFTLHHVVVLMHFFPTALWFVALLSGGIAMGGCFWAWLYDRTGSIFDTWLSHLLIDAGIFFGVGYPLIQPVLGA
ncbi:MAG: CPBP family intramembrane metalloprotease [Pirellulales bacterium]|nr:CPBP family intramembrane metalloprotease [Pirellulales bacterium]